MRYKEIVPAINISSHIQNYWEFDATEYEGDPYIHHVMPDGCVSLIYVCPAPGSKPVGNAPSLMIMGPRLTELQIPIHAGGRWWGVRLWPDSCMGALAQNAKFLKDKVGPAFVFLPEVSGELVECFEACSNMGEAAASLNEYWSKRIGSAAFLDPIVRAGVKAIIHEEGQIRISDIAKMVALGERQFTRRFQRAVGLTPKQFSRIRRFRSSVGKLFEPKPHTWSRVAMELGYSDQAHMTREFSDLVGLSPRQFERRVAQIEHQDVTP